MNVNALIKLASLANKVRPHIPQLQFIFDCLKQYNHELAKSYRAKPPWLDAQLKKDYGPGIQFMLNFPAKDAGALAKRLRRAFGNPRKGEWFTLNENERRKLQMIAAIVMAGAGDTLGMAPVDEEDVKLAKDLIKRLAELAVTRAPSVAQATPQPDAGEVPIETVPDFEHISALPDLDWNWENVLTKDYRAPPELRGNEAYLTVICDNNASVGKVFIDNHPAESIDAALAEQWQRIALELTLIMKVDNRKNVSRTLQTSADDQGENGWASYSDEALGDVKQAARPYLYGFKPFLRPKTDWGLTTLASRSYRSLPKLRGQQRYVCVVQGKRRGDRYKIWRTQLPRDTGGLAGMAAQLNNPHDALHARNRVWYSWIIPADHAETFEPFLKERYSKSRKNTTFMSPTIGIRLPPHNCKKDAT